MSKRKAQDEGKDEGDIPISSRVQTSFRPNVIRDVLKSEYSDPKNKITDDALDMVTQITKLMVVEATDRAARHALAENQSVITLAHIKHILPKMMLDYP